MEIASRAASSAAGKHRQETVGVQAGVRVNAKSEVKHEVSVESDRRSAR
jgi:hypothetical protein